MILTSHLDVDVDLDVDLAQAKGLVVNIIVTFSVDEATCTVPLATSDELLKLSDMIPGMAACAASVGAQRHIRYYVFAGGWLANWSGSDTRGGY